MKEYTFGKANFRIVIRRNGEYRKFGATDCHEAKSLAGATFYHDPKVESVYVGDKLGNKFLYLVKGKPDKTINVPSELAMDIAY